MPPLKPLFKLASLIALLGWLMLVALPSWAHTAGVVVGVVVVLLTFIYAWLLVAALRQRPAAPRGGRQAGGHAVHGEQQGAVGSRSRGDMPVGHLGGTCPVRIQHDHPPAAFADRFELSSEIGCRSETSVGHQRISADDDQIVGPVEIRNRERHRGTEHVTARDVLGHLVQGAGGEDIAGAQGPDDGRHVERPGNGVGVRVAQVDPDRRAAGGRDDPPQALGGSGERLIPTGLDQFAVAAHQRSVQPVGIVVEFGETGPLGADEPVTEDVIAVAAGAGDAVVLDGQDQPAGGFTEGTDAQCGLAHPSHCAPAPRLLQGIRSNQAIDLFAIVPRIRGNASREAQAMVSTGFAKALRRATVGAAAGAMVVGLTAPVADADVTFGAVATGPLFRAAQAFGVTTIDIPDVDVVGTITIDSSDETTRDAPLVMPHIANAAPNGVFGPQQNGPDDDAVDVTQENGGARHIFDALGKRVDLGADVVDDPLDSGIEELDDENQNERRDHQRGRDGVDGQPDGQARVRIPLP